MKVASIKETLLMMAQPDLYRLNDFRVMNLPTFATEREIQKHLRKMQLEQKFGGAAASVKPSIAASPLPLDPPPSADMIAEAQSHLVDAERRLIGELFWFWPSRGLQSADENNGAGAFHQYSFENAVSFWTTLRERGGEEEGIAAHNLAVLFHAAALDIEWNTGRESPSSDEQKQRLAHYWSSAIKLWRHVVTDDHAWEYLSARVEELNDPRLKVETLRRLRLNLPIALLTINARLAVSASLTGATDNVKRHVELMQAFDFLPEVIAEARQYVIEPVIHHIHDLCATMGADAKKTPEQALQIAEGLLERARPLLMAVDDLLPAGDPQRPDVLDAVALAASDATIIKSRLLSHYIKRDWISAQKFLERTTRYAATPPMRAHINESLIWVRDNIRFSDHKSCWFCSEHEGVAEAIIIKMYKMVEANKYHYTDVLVPRCSRCKREHEWVNIHAVLGAVAGVAVALVGWLALALVLWLPNKPDTEPGEVLWAVFLSTVICGGIGGALAHRLSTDRLLKRTKPQQHKWSFPEVLELRSKYWTHNKPS